MNHIILLKRSVGVLALFLFVFFVASAAHAATTPSLGVANTFAVLAHTFTNTTIGNGTTIFGDVGYTTFPGVSVFVSGATHVNDATYTQAGVDQHAALSALNSQPCTFTFSGAVDLATDISHGALGVYTPGVYCSLGAMSIDGGGTITFDGAGTYIFRSSGMLSTSNFSQVTVTNGASACDVFWTPQFPTPLVSTALGSDTKFVGTVIEPVGAAHSDITVGGGTSWVGRALAFDWDVTTNPVIMKYVTITAPTCPVPPPQTTATLHVIKTFYNDYGGTAVSSDANIHVRNGAGDVVGSPLPGMDANSGGRPYTVNADTYIVSEDTFAGYTPIFSGDCDVNGHVTLASGENKTCTIANDQNPPAPATLHIIKHVINDNGGTATASSFMLHVKGFGSMGINDVVGSPLAGVESPGISYILSAGTYAVSENPFSGYAQSFSGDCDDGGNITLVSGADKTCTITNNDIIVPSVLPATLHVVKIVINDNGGKAVVSEAVVHVTSGVGDVAGSPQAGTISPGTSYVLNPGMYTVSENFFPGYTVKLGGDCAENGSVALVSGDDKTCTITNNDIAGLKPPSVPPTITPPPPYTPPITTPPLCDICSRLTYDVYIINPNGSERHTGTPWVRVTDRGNGIKRYSFEDATIDPKNPLYDYNDSVVDVDFTDCKGMIFMFVSSDASWKHQIRIKVSIDGVQQSDTLVVNDSKAVVGTIKTVNATTGVNTKIACAIGGTPSSSASLNGKILLQVQQHGEAWYVHPDSGLRYYMKDGQTAYQMMRNFGLGITDKNLTAIPSIESVDALKASTSACSGTSAANKVKGKILLQVQQHGEAWYVDVTKCRRIYLKDGAAAYTVMRFLGLGITDANLVKLKIGQ
ncbi:MAG: ice-binding family protein [bacterium]|nr:ice-binding family protein [bacterium]